MELFTERKFLAVHNAAFLQNAERLRQVCYTFLKIGTSICWRFDFSKQVPLERLVSLFYNFTR